MSIHVDSNLNSIHQSFEQEKKSHSSLNAVEGSLVETGGLNAPAEETEPSFKDLGVKGNLLAALEQLGYVQPSPIQKKCIPILLQGKDLLGMAETGSGKTAAFCLPGLQNLDLKKAAPQMLVLTPTRELALQVSQACESYAAQIKHVNVATIYGGQSYDIQKRALKKGAHVVVATPGRLLDFIESKLIDLSQVSFVILDEADEILRMGFVEAINEILKTLPEKRQTALFSATMPDAIRRITHNYMNNPTEVRIQSKQRTAKNIEQRYCLVNPAKKLKVLERFLEAETFESAIIFVKTKGATAEVASFVERLGYRCAALNGDMTQSLREQTLGRLRANKINILVATDVAARGLDIEHLALVINYDFPGELESYVHRIGRTGRAGRAGAALLFVESGQERGLRRLEKMLGARIEQAEIPSAQKISEKRFEKLLNELSQKAVNEEHQLFYSKILNSLKEKLEMDAETLAFKLLMSMERSRALFVREYTDLAAKPSSWEHSRTSSFKSGVGRGNFEKFGRGERGAGYGDSASKFRSRRSEKMKIYRLEMGRQMGLHAKHLVGALINEGRISSHSIGNIKLFPRHTHIEISEEIASDKINNLARVKIFNCPMVLSAQS